MGHESPNHLVDTTIRERKGWDDLFPVQDKILPGIYLVLLLNPASRTLLQTFTWLDEEYRSAYR